MWLKTARIYLCELVDGEKGEKVFVLRIPSVLVDSFLAISCA